MPYYIINANPNKNGFHELHIKDDCKYIPNEKEQIKVGYFFECSAAIRHLQILYPGINFDSCDYCCNIYHRD